MTLMAGHPAPYGDLLMQSGGAAGAPHLHDYLTPVDGECWTGWGQGAGQKMGTDGTWLGLTGALAAPFGGKEP